MKPLDGQIAVVAGATRGAGRGAARALGEAGALVYCTGRSVRGRPSSYGRPETIDETVEMITASGGQAVAVPVDHTDEAAVRQLFERIGNEHGRLDILVNAVAGQDSRMAGWDPIWKTDLSQAADVHRHAVLSHLINAKYAAPIMIRKKRGLIVEITESDTLTCGGNLVAQQVKAAVTLLAFQLAEELRPYTVTALAIAPGFLRSEMMLDHFGVTEANWRDAGKQDEHFLESESPLFVGRAVAALAADPAAFRHSGRLTSSWALAREYGFSDYDGRQPDMGACLKRVWSAQPQMAAGLRRLADWLGEVERRTRDYLGEG